MFKMYYIKVIGTADYIQRSYKNSKKIGESCEGNSRLEENKTKLTKG